MSVPINDRYVKATAAAGQTVFNYDWDVPTTLPQQVIVIKYDPNSVPPAQKTTTLNFGVDYIVDVGEKKVTLTNPAQAGETYVIYSGTPYTRETDFTGSTVNVTAANEAIDNLTWQTQQLARDVKRCVRVDMVEGIMAGELPSVDARKNKYASWDNDGNLTYDDPVTGILNDYMRKDQNLSDVASVATARTNLGLGDAATRNVGTTAGTVCAGDDTRFLTQAQKDALTNGGNANTMHIHSGYIATAEKGAANGLATLDGNGRIPAVQLPNTSVTSVTNTSTDNEVVVFNSVGGNSIKRSNKLIPAGDIVGTTDAQTLTNKTINADNNTVTELEVDNLKAGVLNTDLTGAVTNTQVPSAQATKDYADTKMGTLVNLGAGAQVGNRLNNGALELRTLVAKDGIYLVQNENDIYIYATDEQLFPNFEKQGNGADWLVDVQGQDVNYRSFTGSNGITITENADEIDTSLTNITAQGDMIVGDNTGTASTLAKGADDQVLRMDGDDPQWETLGTMADQDSDAVAISGGGIDSVTITGGTISGLDDAIAIADGGTGQTTKQDAFDALSPLTTEGDLITYDGVNNVRLGLGNAGEVLKTNATEDGLEWGVGYVSPTTTQGDLIVRGAADDERLAIGTAGQVLKVNAAGTDPEWGSATSPTLTTQGDLLTRDGTGEVRLPIGTAGQVLQVNAGGTAPEWATLGTMSAQDANAVNITGGAMDSVAITGGTISGLTTPLAVADGGTGLNAVGTINQAPVVNLAEDGLVYHPVAFLKPLGPTITDMNTATTPGTRIVSPTATNRPPAATTNYHYVDVRQQQNITQYMWQDFREIASNRRFARYTNDSGTTWSDWECLNHPFLQCARRQASTQTISVNTTTKLDFNGVNYTNYSVESGYGWDTTNSCFVAPFKGNFVFRLDAVFYYKYTTDEVDPIYNSVNYMKFTLYKNNSAVSDKNMMNLNGKALRPGLMWFWIAEKGDVFDVRVYSKTALTMPNSVATPNNYEDSALYIWSV